MQPADLEGNVYSGATIRNCHGQLKVEVEVEQEPTWSVSMDVEYVRLTYDGKDFRKIGADGAGVKRSADSYLATDQVIGVDSVAVIKVETANFDGEKQYVVSLSGD